MARLAAHLLGPLQASLDGKPVAGFESDKARALLAYLVTEAERPHRREKLAGLLWPDRPERVARANLRRVLVNIRQVIGDRHTAPPFLAITPQTIQLDATDELWSDVAAFSTFQSTDLRAGLTLTQQAIDRIEEAVVLYRGDFLEGFSLPANAAFEEWILVNRERYRRLAMQAMLHLVEHYGQCGDRGRALKYAWRQLEVDPWQEDAHVQVMRLLALDGQRGAALAQYETVRRLLGEEFGVEPAAETTRMYQRIRSGEYPNAGERGGSPRAVASGPQHNLPVLLVPLIGRETELAAIGRCLGDPGCRLLTLVGPGGIGKTHLALEAAASQVDRFAHGVYLVSLSPLTASEEVVPAVAQAIDLTFRQGEEPRRQLLDYLRGRQVLLLLDGFEHLLGYPVCSGKSRGEPSLGTRPEPGQRSAARLATEILEAASGVKILVTSRARLDVQGEHVLPIYGLDLPSAPARADAVDCSAVQLFLSGARRIHPGLESTPADLIEIARICRLVGGVPLGILRAAAWVETLGPGEIADGISRGLDFLVAGRGDVLAAGALGGERQRSLRAVFEHSWGLLSAREQEALKKLSVFCSDFTYEAARQVAGVTLHELKALTDTSMVEPRHGARYAIHELLRYYAAEKLAQTPDLEEAVRDGHCAYYATLLQGYAKHLKSPRRRTVLGDIGQAFDNARAAWDWAIKRRYAKQVGQAVDGLGHFFEWHGRYAEGETACGAAALEAANAGREVQVCARVLAWESLFAEKSGHLDAAQRAAGQSLAALDDRSLAGLDVRPERAFALRQAARAALHTDLGHSRQLGEQSLDLYRALGDQWGMANVLDELGWAASLLGDYGAARCFYEESLRLHQTLGNPRGIASSLGALGYTLFHNGQVEEAERLVRESIASRKEMADWAGATEELFTLGLTLVWLGKLAEADSLLEESVASYQAMGGLAEVARLYAVLSQIKALQGSYERARTLAQTCLSMAQESGSWREIGISCWVLGGVATAEQAYARAQGWLQESVAVLQKVGMPDVLNAALATSGYAAWGAGQPLQAKEYLARALHDAQKTQSLGALLFVLPGVALLMVSRGEIERAIELYALASRHPLVTNARWFEDIAGRYIADAAAGLPSHVVSAARVRGLALNLDGAVAGVMTELDEQDEQVHGAGV
jgi:DNA-binding SARP family transcriptional activator/predicted ATPase